MPRALSDRALGTLALLPPPLRSTALFQATAAAQADQFDQLDAAMARLQALLIPASVSDADLPIWEAQAGITPLAGASLADRRQVLGSYMALMVSDGSGMAWEDNVTRLLGQLNVAWSYTHNPSTRTITVLLASTSLPTQYAGSLLRLITPAPTTLVVGTSTGFSWDASLWDEDIWH